MMQIMLTMIILITTLECRIVNDQSKHNVTTRLLSQQFNIRDESLLNVVASVLARCYDSATEILTAYVTSPVKILSWHNQIKKDTKVLYWTGGNV